MPVAELVVEGSQLVVRLSWWERIAAVHGNVRVPLSSVTSTRVEARAADALRQPWFRPGAGAWESLDMGYGVRGYGSGFVALRQRRRRSAVLVYLDPPPSRSRGFSALLVTVADPAATAAHIMDAKHGHRGAEDKPAHVHARRLWLPWRPRLRLIFAYPRAGAYVAAGLRWFNQWQHRRFTGWLRPVMVAIFLLPYLYALLFGFALVAEVTILAFGASVYLVLGEWLLLALMFPFVAVARLASVRPWPLIAVAGPQRWTARVAGWSASGKVAAAAAGALTSGAGLAAPPWSPGARAALIWT